MIIQNQISIFFLGLNLCAREKIAVAANALIDIAGVNYFGRYCYFLAAIANV